MYTDTILFESRTFNENIGSRVKEDLIGCSISKGLNQNFRDSVNVLLG